MIQKYNSVFPQCLLGLQISQETSHRLIEITFFTGQNKLSFRKKAKKKIAERNLSIVPGSVVGSNFRRLIHVDIAVSAMSALKEGS